MRHYSKRIIKNEKDYNIEKPLFAENLYSPRTFNVNFNLISNYVFTNQNGFDRIQQIVPSLNENKNGKTSKAQILQKTAEYIRELQDVRNRTVEELQISRNQIEILSQQISELQGELPESGVALPGSLNKQEKFQQKFVSYVQQRTIENWKFYIFSMVLKPLFESYASSINTLSGDHMQNSMNDWQNKYCNLSQMRRSNHLLPTSRTVLSVV
jgi:MAX-like protein X